MRRLFLTFFVLGYMLVPYHANAQDDFDSSLIINNQIDQNAIQTLDSNSYPAPSSETNQPTSTITFMEHRVVVGTLDHIPGSPNSTYSALVKPVSLQLINIDSFSSKNSFLGMGVTTSYQTQIGVDTLFSTGTDVQSLLSYQHMSKDLVGTNTSRSDAYGGSINIVQRIFPFDAILHNQPKATADFGPDTNTTEKAVRLADGNYYIHDFYPSYDVNVGLLGSLNAPDIATLSHNTWKNSNQNAYTLAPQVITDFYLRPTYKCANSNPDRLPEWLPNNVSLLASYTDQMTMVDNGTSSSAGFLTFQARNNYVIPLREKVIKNDPETGLPPSLAPVAASTLQITQTMALLHDTNEEMLPGSTTPVAYQNWGRFGVALTYTDIEANFSAKLEYSYDAFNAQYDNHLVSLTMSYKFF